MSTQLLGHGIKVHNLKDSLQYPSRLLHEPSFGHRRVHKIRNISPKQIYPIS